MIVRDVVDLHGGGGGNGDRNGRIVMCPLSSPLLLFIVAIIVHSISSPTSYPSSIFYASINACLIVVNVNVNGGGCGGRDHPRLPAAAASLLLLLVLSVAVVVDVIAFGAIASSGRIIIARSR